MKKRLFLLLAGCFLFCGCDRLADDAAKTARRDTSPIVVTPSAFDLTDYWDEDETVTVTLADGASTANGSGVTVEGNVVSIVAEGRYLLSGTLSEGQIRVAVNETEKVHLILNGVTVSSTVTAPLYLQKADKTVITTVVNTINTFCDEGQARAFNEDLRHNLNACIYAADDITLNGAGALILRAHNNGIGCKNDVRILGGIIDITAAQNGIKGHNGIYIAGGEVTLNAGKDGLKATAANAPNKGYVCITGGTVHITAGDDGIDAVYNVTITGGDVTLRAADEKIHCTGSRTLDLSLIH